MDVVVVLALLVLSIVFVMSLTVLVLMCYRRKQILHAKTPSPQVLSKLVENADNIDNLGQLSPLIGELLDKNIWVYDASGLLQHCVALLRLCRTLTEQLAVIPLHHAPQPISDAICMATRNIFPRFDDLLDIVASNTVDVRVLEARAMSLGTVCWALYLPFTLLNPKFKEILNEPLNEMNLHLVTIRTAIEFSLKTDAESKENQTWGDVKNNLFNFKNDIQSKVIYKSNYEENCSHTSSANHQEQLISNENMPLVNPETETSKNEVFDMGGKVDNFSNSMTSKPLPIYNLNKKEEMKINSLDERESTVFSSIPINNSAHPSDPQV